MTTDPPTTDPEPPTPEPEEPAVETPDGRADEPAPQRVSQRVIIPNARTVSLDFTLDRLDPEFVDLLTGRPQPDIVELFRPLNVHEAIIAVMRDVGAVAKSRYNEGQKFNFRGIDNFLNSVHPVMAKHGLTIVPKLMDHAYELHPRVNDQGKTYGMTTQVFNKVTWEATGPDGSQTTFQTIGEAADVFDKATNKTISAAEKYMLISVFKIPTEDMADGDAENPNMGGSDEGAPAQGPRRQQQRGQQQRGPTGAKGTPPATPPDGGEPPSENEGKKPTQVQLDNIKALANEVVGTNTPELKAVMMAITNRVAVRSHLTYDEAVTVIGTLGKIKAGDLVLVKSPQGVKIYDKGEEPFDAPPDTSSAAVREPTEAELEAMNNESGY